MYDWIIDVPATSANLGPGYDCLGLALGLYDHFAFSLVEGPIEKAPLYASREESPYNPEGNLVIDSYWTYGQREKLKLPAIRVDIKGDIPTTRGLGSSAACSIAGVLAGAIYSGQLGSFEELENKLDDKNYYYPMHAEEKAEESIREAAVFMEGHPDNAIPALYGGLYQSAYEKGKTFFSKLPLSKDLRYVLIIPDFTLSTEKARGILPEKIDRVKACQNIGYFAFLLEGLRTGRSDYLRLGLRDNLHEPYRKTLIPSFDEVKEKAIQAGAIGTVISGAGSTILCILNEDSPSTSVFLENFGSLPEAWKALDLSVDEKGPRISKAN